MFVASFVVITGATTAISKSIDAHSEYVPSEQIALTYAVYCPIARFKNWYVGASTTTDSASPKRTSHCVSVPATCQEKLVVSFEFSITRFVGAKQGVAGFISVMLKLSIIAPG